MAAAFYPDQGYFIGIEPTQFFAVPDRNEAIPGAMQDVGMATHLFYPAIGTQVVSQYNSYRKKGKKAFHYFSETVIGGVQYQVAGLIVGCQFGGKAAADAAPVYDQVVFGVFFYQCLVNELNIVEHFLLGSFSGAFPKTAIVYQHHIIVVPVKIAGIFCPAFDASCISMEIKNEALGLFTIKMEAIDPYARLYIEEQLFKWRVVAKFEVGVQLLRLKYEFLLDEIGSNAKQYDAGQDIPDQWHGIKM